jgi:CRP/FNR family transcriptional regulator
MTEQKEDIMLGEKDLEFLAQSLPFWQSLSLSEKDLIRENTRFQSYHKGMLQYGSRSECAGLILVQSGQLRAYINSDDGREISLYRLLPLDICIMSASCMLKNLSFEIQLSTEKNSALYIIPTPVFESISNQNPAVKSFLLELMSARFSDVMWVLEQLVFSNVGKRLASVLLEQSVLSGALVLEVTHEEIAKDIGTAREVVTRLLKQFQLDGMVKLFRSRIEIINENKLRRFAE